jgi:virulence-associated protein VapD
MSDREIVTELRTFNRAMSDISDEMVRMRFRLDDGRVVSIFEAARVANSLRLIGNKRLEWFAERVLDPRHLEALRSIERPGGDAGVRW